MTHSRKLLALLLALTLLVFSACGAQKESEVADPAPSETEPVTSDTQEESVPEEPEEEPPVRMELTPAVQPVLSDYSYTLTEVGSFETFQGLAFSAQLPVVRSAPVNGRTTDTLLSPLGQDLLGTAFHTFTYFGDGLAAGYTYADGPVPTCSLVNAATGETLLDDGAARITKLSDRYFYVVYVTEPTEIQDNAFIYFTDRADATAPEAGDAFYMGYANIYDLDNGCFVEGVEITNASNDVVISGETLCVETSRNCYDLYLTNGTIISGVENLYPGTDGLIQRDKQNCIVYDSEFNRLTHVVGVSPINTSDNTYSTHYFALKNKEGQVGVVDRNGDEILPCVFSRIALEQDGYFAAADSSDLLGLFHADGTELAGFAYSSAEAGQADGLPIFTLQQESGTSWFIPGIGVSNLSRTGDCFFSDAGCLLLATGETAELPNATPVTAAIVCSEGSLVELLHGEVLIENVFLHAFGTEEYLYVLDEDHFWHVYRYSLTAE